MAQLAQVNIEVTLGGPARPAASVAAEVAPPTTDRNGALNALWRMFNAIAGWLIAAVVRVRVDAITEYAARATYTVTQANLAAGETIKVVIPGHGTFVLTAVAAVEDSEGGEFVSETDDTTTVNNIIDAVNNMRGLKDLILAENDGGDLVFISRIPGALGNEIRVIDGTTDALSPAGGLLAGGLAAYDEVTSVITCVQANTDADDTLRIGKTTFTAKAGTAAGDSQFNLGASNTAMGDNLLAKIVAHPDLAGLVTGVAASGVITLTWTCPARLAVHAGYMVTSDADGLVITSQPTTNLTLANQQATREYVCGA